MRFIVLLPLVLFGLAACIHAETTTSPKPASTTVVTPAPSPPASSTTVVRTP